MSIESKIPEMHVEQLKVIEREIEPRIEVVGPVSEISMGKLRGKEKYLIMK